MDQSRSEIVRRNEGSLLSETLLSDEDIPDNEDDFGKLLLDRPKDVYAWAMDAKRRMAR